MSTFVIWNLSVIPNEIDANSDKKTFEQFTFTSLFNVHKLKVFKINGSIGSAREKERRL